MNNKIIKYGELLQKIKDARKVRDRIIVIAFGVGVIALALIFFLNNSTGSFIDKAVIPISVLLIGVAIMIFRKLKFDKKITELSKYRDEIDNYCSIITFDYNYIYTKNHIISTGVNGAKFYAISFDEIESAHEISRTAEVDGGGPLIYNIELNLNDGKRYILPKTNELQELLQKFYSKDEQINTSNNLSDKKTVSQIKETFNHNKYGIIEYSKTGDSIDGENSEVVFKLKNNKLVIFVPDEKVDELLKSDEIKKSIIDKYYEYAEKYLLKSKKLFVESACDVILDWFKDSEKDIESSPLYTKNKTKEEFKKTLVDDDNYNISSIYIDKNYIIINAIFEMSFDDFYCFDVHYDPKTEEVYYDVIS